MNKNTQEKQLHKKEQKKITRENDKIRLFDT